MYTRRDKTPCAPSLPGPLLQWAEYQGSCVLWHESRGADAEQGTEQLLQLLWSSPGQLWSFFWSRLIFLYCFLKNFFYHEPTYEEL